MQKDVIEAIARLAVQGLVKESGTQVDHLDLKVWLEDELPGLEEHVFDDVLTKAQVYLDIAEVHVEIPFWRLEQDEAMQLLGVTGSL